VSGPLESTGDTRLFEAGERPSRKALFVRDLPDGETIETILLVKESVLAQRKSGDDYLRLKLSDCTGTLEAVAWDGVAEVREIAQPGIALRVRGRYEVSQRYGPQLVLKSASLAQTGDYLLADLMEGPAASAEQMEADLRRLIATVRNPWLQSLLDALLGPGSPVWKRFQRAPAAKYYHQAYLHGLLEHSLSVGQAVSAVSGSFPGVDRDLAVTGALIHDIGKIEAYDSDPVAIDLSDEGRLLGEIPLGYYMVRSTIERLDGFPPELGRAVLHIVLSHHGALENGSPVIPCTREATVVHAIDNLGGKLGSFDRLEKGLQDGETWSRFDRALSGAAHFPRFHQEPQPVPEPVQETLPAASGE
jgi:3'-5' exoribonuclease